MLFVFDTNIAMLLFNFGTKMFVVYAIFQESKNNSVSGHNGSHPSAILGRCGEDVVDDVQCYLLIIFLGQFWVKSN